MQKNQQLVDGLSRVQLPPERRLGDVRRELMQSLTPAIWVLLPASVQDSVIRRVEESVPELLGQLKSEHKDYLEAVVNLNAVAVNVLRR